MRIKKMAILRKQDRTDRIIPERTERVYDNGGLWYFRTRDRGNIGPFRYQSEARQMLQNFIRDMQAADVVAAKSGKPRFRLNAIARSARGSMGAMGFGN